MELCQAVSAWFLFQHLMPGQKNASIVLLKISFTCVRQRTVVEFACACILPDLRIICVQGI